MRASLFAAIGLAVCAVLLGGCAEFSQLETKISGVISAVTGSTVSPAAIIISADAFDALEATAKNYVNPRLNKRCDGSNGPICRDPKATVAINAAIRSGRVARNNAKQFLRDHPGQLGSQGLYDALQASVSTLQGIFRQYGIGGAL
jgi:hypothetical protein